MIESRRSRWAVGPGLAVLGAGLLAAALASAGCKKTQQSQQSQQGGGSQQAEGDSSVVVLDGSNFKTVTAKGIVLVDFWATWCPPCRRQGPIVDKVAGEFAGRAVVGKLDTDKNQAIAKQFEIEAIPTLIVFKDGKVFRRMVGLQDAGELKGALESALRGG